MNRKELSCSRLSQIVVVGIQPITSTTNSINLYCHNYLWARHPPRLFCNSLRAFPPRGNLHNHPFPISKRPGVPCYPLKLLGSLPGHLLSRFVALSLAYIRSLSMCVGNPSLEEKVNSRALQKLIVLLL